MEQFGILSLGSRLKRLSDYLFNEVQQIYLQRNIPISSTYFPILRLLQERYALSVVEIADQLGISHPAVSKQVTKMLKEGLLVKEGDKRDQRKSLLRFTDKGKDAMSAVEPVLAAIKMTLETLTATDVETFMRGFDMVEERILASRFSEVVLRNLTLTSFEVVPFSVSYRSYFKALNMAWLKEYFPDQITDHDIQILDDPESTVLEQGGAIWFALSREDDSDPVAGTVALMSLNEEEYEIMKLAVAPDHQHQGVGTLLIKNAIEYARKQGATRVSLETASSLQPALRLYKRLGFTEQKSPRAPSMNRVDKYMALALSGNFGDNRC
jgi:ribosomal protein S18 acetylase RimI-like enzyme/DNA-binding MarR family transcriptional regulator